MSWPDPIEFSSSHLIDQIGEGPLNVRGLFEVREEKGDSAQRDLQALSNFVHQNSFLYSLFLLWQESQDVLGRGELDAQKRFIAWFLLEGRRLYAVHAVVERASIEALTRRDAQGGHTLMRMVAQVSGKDLDGPAMRSWYRREGVPRFNLMPFLGVEEIELFLTNDGGLSRGEACEHRHSVADSDSRAVAATSAEIVCSERLGPWDDVGQGKPTVSIVGFHRSVLGLGEDARTLFDCLCQIGIPPELVDVSPQGLEPVNVPDAYAPFEAPRPTGSIVIFCLPAFEMMRALAKLNFNPSRGRYVIGYWPWETTALPAVWDHAYNHVDEIWASSRFLQQVYAPKTPKPVTHVPLHVSVDVGPLRLDLKAIFDEAFSFFSVFDFYSGMERKNPEGTIDAFVRAFPKGAERVQLILKTIHGENRPTDLARLVSRAREDGRIIVIDGAMPRSDLCAMLAAADAYVSLHRAEGFGRPMAEAMMLGTPVVATAWSGCEDFLNTETGYPVQSKLRAVRIKEYPFAAGSWAEPNIEHAATQMRNLFFDQQKVFKIRSAQNKVGALYSRNAVASVIKEHIDRIEKDIRSSW